MHRVTGGNPLAVLELAQQPSRLLSLAPGTTPTPVPATLTTWFGQRATALGPHARTVLLLVAICGGDLAVVTRACARLGVAVSALADAERAGLVEVRTDRVDFVHPLVRASLYAVASPGERRSLHAAVADAVPPTDPDRRAWHRCEATLGLDDVIAAEMEAVARRADGRAAHAVSTSAYERSAQLTVDVGERARRLQLAAEAAWRGGDGDVAVRLAEQVLAVDRAPAVRARALGLHGDIALHRGATLEARRLFVAAAEEVEADDPSRAVMLLAEAINACYFSGDAGAALATAGRADALLRRGPIAPTAEAVGTMATGMARVLAGRPGIDLIRDGVHLLATATDPGAAGLRPAWLMLGPMWLRESGTGRALVRTVLDETRSRSAVGTLPTLLFTIARDGATTDHWASAEADYGEAIALARELSQTSALAISLAGLAWLEARFGRPDDCRRHAAEALTLCAAQPINIARVWAEFALGELAIATGDVASAVEQLSGLTRFLAEIDLRDPDLFPAPELAEALLRSGHEEAARALAVDYEARAAAKGLPWAQARAARLRGLLSGPDELDECFAAAFALHARTLDVFEEARSRLAYGARLRRARRRADARVPLRSALAVFDRLGARPWADVTVAELRATGETIARHGSGHADLLTARELQIALQLAAGRTTREAAAALFLSPKTVEYNLRHVYTKLGIGTRAELVARLADAAG
jgi:DNA-binding CsgD family transcriptional regulator